MPCPELPYRPEIPSLTSDVMSLIYGNILSFDAWAYILVHMNTHGYIPHIYTHIPHHTNM